MPLLPHRPSPISHPTPTPRPSYLDLNRQPPGVPPQCNFDDFNEFFWTTECLNYSYYTSDASDGIASSQVGMQRGGGPYEGGWPAVMDGKGELGLCASWASF